MIRAEETWLGSAREQNEREKKQEKTDRGMRNEGPAVQLNCYDIIRGDPSGTGGSVLSLLLFLSLFLSRSRWWCLPVLMVVLAVE